MLSGCRIAALYLSVLSVVFSGALAAATNTKPFEIYFIDVEGGQATLLVTPSRQSLLVDTGGFDPRRDAGRIVAAAHQAGLKQLDYVLITHFHPDHVGGVQELTKAIPVRTFIDHGRSFEDSEEDQRALYASYTNAIAGHPHLVVTPGSRIPIKGMDIRVVTAAYEHINSALTGAGEADPYCASEPAAELDPSEDAASVGLLITYGRFRFLDLGDLTKRKEVELVCPTNRLGAVDLFLVSHHGLDRSNSKALVWAVRPRVAIFDNGPRKGANRNVWQVVHDSPGLEDIWQLHYAEASDQDHNVMEMRIANLPKQGDGNYIKVSAEKAGTFTVFNSRTGARKTYRKS